jgi:hypothetical protein
MIGSGGSPNRHLPKKYLPVSDYGWRISHGRGLRYNRPTCEKFATVRGRRYRNYGFRKIPPEEGSRTSSPGGMPRTSTIRWGGYGLRTNPNVAVLLAKG